MSEFKSWNSYSAFARRIQHGNRFVRTPVDDSFFREVLRTSLSRIREMRSALCLWWRGWHPWELMRRNCPTDGSRSGARYENPSALRWVRKREKDTRKRRLAVLFRLRAGMSSEKSS